MLNQELIKLLETKISSYRDVRERYAKHILSNKDLFLPLLKIAFEVNNKTSIRACWVLEFVLREKLEWIFPHLNYFVENISKIHFDSSTRPIAKICEFLAKDYTSKKETKIKKHLTKKHIDTIIETGFDWLISDQKVAVKVYTMESLFLFGKEKNWVHDELKLIIQQEIMNGSPAYKARGKRILKRLK
ncbi:MAG: adenylosuccinate lyase [Lutibacter sp.]|nr:MAG: adenylosuccinate lyase [Lutibacter sp.]